MELRDKDDNKKTFLSQENEEKESRKGLYFQKCYALLSRRSHREKSWPFQSVICTQRQCYK